MRTSHPAAGINPDIPLAASPAVWRGCLLAVLVLAAIAGFASTSHGQTSSAVNQAGGDLARLMRFMVVVKSLLAAFATAGLLWRLGAPVSIQRLAVYLVAAGTMAAGPGLIWGMVHVSLGAVLLHGGLFALVILLWRDPATSALLAELIASRRTRSLTG